MIYCSKKQFIFKSCGLRQRVGGFFVGYIHYKYLKLIVLLDYSILKGLSDEVVVIKKGEKGWGLYEN